MADCVFCKIVNKEIPADSVYEDARVVAFRDIHPKAATHVLVVPKKHIAGVENLSEETEAAGMMNGAREVIKKLGLKDYKVVINGGVNQEVKHLHFHIMSGEGGVKI